jgi:DNA-binding transcriptional ArsR family regulator
MTIQRRLAVDDLMAAVGDPTRRAMFEAIAAQPGVTTSQLTSRASTITRWAVMKHLAVLRDAGLIQTMATGRLRRHYAEKAALGPLRDWLARVTGGVGPNT